MVIRTLYTSVYLSFHVSIVPKDVSRQTDVGTQSMYGPTTNVSLIN